MRQRIAFAAIVLILVAHALFFYRAIGWDAVNDAYISFVYARNAILGYGLTFNPSERVEGFTNFLWTAMMTPVVGAGLDAGRVSSVLGLAFAVGVLALVVRLPALLRVSPWIGWMAALFLAVDGSFALWSVGGLETPLFAFLITLGAFLYLREQRGTASGAASGIVFALAGMTRPEAGAVFALTAAHQLVWRLLDERKLWARRDLVRVAAFTLMAGSYWLVRWRYYHSFFPNSFYAKVSPGGPIAQVMRGWEHLQQFVSVHLSWLILVPAALAVAAALWRYAQARRTASDVSREQAAHIAFACTYFALVTVAYSAYIVYVGGDWSVGRFFVPILPLFYFLVAAGLVEIARMVARRVPAGRRFRTTLAAAAAVLALAILYSSAWLGEYGIFIRSFDAARATEARITMGKWLKANVSPGTWIAVDAAGQVPYFSELPAIDMFGINDLHIGRLAVANLGGGTPGHEKFDLGYIIARAPKYVVIYGTLFDNVSEYRRAQVKWTDKVELESFLTLYERADGR